MTRGIFILSLNSRRLQDAIRLKNNFNFNYSIDELDVFVFDVYEVLNGIFFTESDVRKQKESIEAIIQQLEDGFIAIDTVKRELIRCSSQRKNLSPYLTTLYGEYYSNPVFQSHCKNQIFKNLQPKLKRLDITSNKSPLLEILVPFLLVEIAIYLFINHTNKYDKIFGMEDEMDIVAAIKAHKYSVFTKYLTTDVPYIKMNAE
jgi:hypothetical protein